MITTLTRVLDVAMDATLLNREQALLIDNPGTPEVDSLMERIALLEGIVDSATLDALRTDCENALLLHGVEDGHLRRICGLIDQVIETVRARTARGIRNGLNVKSLAKAIVPLLDAGDPIAQRRISVLIREHHRTATRPSFARQLGPGRHAQLVSLLPHLSPLPTTED